MRPGRRPDRRLTAFLPAVTVSGPAWEAGHDPQMCGDPACGRLACMAYRTGYQAGYAVGYGAGYAAGQAAS